MMMITILLLGLAHYWLLIETDWLRVRLPIGDLPRHKLAMTIPEWDRYNKVHAKEFAKSQADYKKAAAIRQSHTCPVCRKYDDSILVETRTITTGNSTCHVTGCPGCIETFNQDIERSQKPSSRKPTLKTTQPPIFIERVRVGSHREPQTMFNGRTFNRIVEDYETVYRDCLIPKEWLEAHEHDLDNYEPTIEITIDDKALSLNGNYKKGMIQGFMTEFTYKARAGKKTMTVSKGEEVVNCGGGVYVSMPPEKIATFREEMLTV